MRTDLLAAIQAEARARIDEVGDTRVVVWGAGELGRWLMLELGTRGVAFVDTNPTKLGTEIAGRPVHAPAQLDEVWIAVLSDSAGVAAQLSARDIPHRIVCPGGKRLQAQDQLPRTLEFLAPFELSGRRVLEVGCGGQLFLALTLAHLGAQSVRVTDVGPLGDPLADRAPEWRAFLAHLEQVHPAGHSPESLLARIELEPRAMDAAHLPFGDASFDAVVNVGVMEHVDDPAGAFAEFARLLRPGGLALCLAIGIHDHRANDPAAQFSPWSFLELDAQAWRALGDGTYHQNRWRSVEFERCAERHDLRILRAQSTRDPRLTAAEVQTFAPEFREAFSLEELADLDLFLAVEAPGA